MIGLGKQEEGRHRSNALFDSQQACACARRSEVERKREEGQALIEYALIISLIALVAIVALQSTGTNISKILNTIAGEV